MKAIKYFVFLSLLLMGTMGSLAQGYNPYGAAEQDSNSGMLIASLANADTIYTVHNMTQEQFVSMVANYKDRDWKMVNPRPVVVDFYADWCQPCKRLEPILRQIAQHYNGKVDFYRINVDQNSDIADVFQIRSVPFLLICPLQGEPKSVIGLYPQLEYIRVIDAALGLN